MGDKANMTFVSSPPEDSDQLKPLQKQTDLSFHCANVSVCSIRLTAAPVKICYMNDSYDGKHGSKLNAV